MATAQTITAYYCHLCQREIEPNLENFTCPACNSGFIEPLSDGTRSNRGHENISPGGAFELLQQLFPGSLPLRGLQNATGQNYFDDDYDFEDEDNDELERPVRWGLRRSSRLASRGNTATHTGRGYTPYRHNIRVSNPHMEGIRVMQSQAPLILQFLSQLEPLQSDARNYVFSQEVFDTIMTQLLNQVPAGPPPATEAAISRLPRVHVSSDELAGKLERCSICFEDYAVGENLLRLPCQHIYHESCIVTWLKRHGTCPVCRKDLSGRDTSCLQPDSEQTNFSGSVSDVEAVGENLFSRTALAAAPTASSSTSSESARSRLASSRHLQPGSSTRHRNSGGDHGNSSSSGGTGGPGSASGSGTSASHGWSGLG